MTSKTLQTRLKILRGGDYSGFSRWALNIIIRDLTRAMLDGQKEMEAGVRVAWGHQLRFLGGF